MRFKRLHPDASLNKSSLAYWRRQPTDFIVRSLAAGNRIGLKAKANGTIMDGNTRMKILEERGVITDDLPYELYPSPES